jgi:hypothetical protein
MADLSDSIAYAAAGISVVLGLVLVGWGRFWSRLLVGLSGVGVGIACGGLLAGTLKVDPWIARTAVASILGVLGFVAAPFFWALFAGAFCASVAGVFLLARFLARPDVTLEVAPPDGGWTMPAWVEWAEVAVRDIGGAMWEQQAAVMLLVMAPVALIPIMFGLWKQRFITIVMTSLIGALTLVGGAVVAIVQSDATRWPKDWSGAFIPLLIVGVLWLIGIAVQYCFALSKARKKKAKEAARAKSDNESGGRR